MFQTSIADPQLVNEFSVLSPSHHPEFCLVFVSRYFGCLIMLASRVVMSKVKRFSNHFIRYSTVQIALNRRHSSNELSMTHDRGQNCAVYPASRQSCSFGSIESVWSPLLAARVQSTHFAAVSQYYLVSCIVSTWRL